MGIRTRVSMTVKTARVLFITASLFFLHSILNKEVLLIVKVPEWEGNLYFSGIFNVSPYNLSFCPEGVVVDEYMGDSSKTPNPRPQTKPMLIP